MFRQRHNSTSNSRPGTFLLDIITIGNLDVFKGITNTTVTKLSGNWYLWGTFLKHTGIANKLLGGGSHKSRGNP